MFRRLSLLTTLCLLAAAGVARSTTVISPTFDQLVAEAQTVFVGEVMNVRAEWEATPSGRAIVTLVTFRVEDVWKGNVGAVTQLEFLGGEIGEIGMKVEGMPVFRLGQRDVLFVGSAVRTVSPLVGFMHGRMRVERDTVSGIDRAAPSLASITPMRLSDLASAVRSRAAAARQR
jgi:hypothetical protein